jgi:hypothetical protein
MYHIIILYTYYLIKIWLKKSEIHIVHTKVTCMKPIENNLLFSMMKPIIG